MCVCPGGGGASSHVYGIDLDHYYNYLHLLQAEAESQGEKFNADHCSDFFADTRAKNGSVESLWHGVGTGVAHALCVERDIRAWPGLSSIV